MKKQEIETTHPIPVSIDADEQKKEAVTIDVSTLSAQVEKYKSDLEKNSEVKKDLELKLSQISNHIFALNGAIAALSEQVSIATELKK